jgi:hypothetical protein
LYKFELNYDDLFKEKEDKIYFLIWFNSLKQINLYWEMGFPFMKKYVFNYNYDNKLISFYNNKINEEDIISNGNSKIMNIIIIIFLIFIVCALGFVIGRKVRRRNRLTAKELEENYNSALYDIND